VSAARFRPQPPFPIQIHPKFRAAHGDFWSVGMTGGCRRRRKIRFWVRQQEPEVAKFAQPRCASTTTSTRITVTQRVMLPVGEVRAKAPPGRLQRIRACKRECPCCCQWC
jgi:hypothetical protein